MKLLKSANIVNIIENTLNHMDNRLVDHGKRVARHVCKALKKKGGFTPTQIRDISILGLIHDIGAYKTEEIHNMVAFETGAVWEHSAYGYLFAKHFSPLKHLSPVLLFHHASLKELEYLHPDYRDIAQIIFVADRIDVLSLHKPESWDIFVEHFNRYGGTLFDEKIIDLFIGKDGCLTPQDLAFQHDPEFDEIMYNSEFSDKEIEDYLNMVVLSIEFRSPQTMNHTFVTIKISEILAKKLGFDAGQTAETRAGALLHDIGKVGMPLHILESTGKLSNEDFYVMKSHVNITKDIFMNYVSDNTLNIAVNHHEKLDGSGYTNRLRADSLTEPERLVAVMDIFSALCGKRTYKETFSKERVLSILTDLKDKGLNDPKIINLTIEHFDELYNAVTEVTDSLTDAYDDIWREYNLLLEITKDFKNGLGKNEMYIKEPLRW